MYDDKGKKINTYGDLIEYIKKNKLEDKRVVVSCQGYNSLYDNDYSDTFIYEYKGIVVIRDNTNSLEYLIEENSSLGDE